MKKLLVLALVLGMATLANAAIVLQLETVGTATDEAGNPVDRDGSQEKPLMPSDTIMLQVTLLNNPFEYQGTPYPDYDGYYCDSFDLDLHVTGLGTVAIADSGPPFFAPDLKYAEGFVGPNSGVSADGKTIDQMAGVTLTPVGPGPQALIWNIIFHCEGVAGAGPEVVLVDLTGNPNDLGVIGSYSAYEKTATGGAWEFIQMRVENLGSLEIWQVPEPLTLSLLGFGGLALLRRRR